MLNSKTQNHSTKLVKWYHQNWPSGRHSDWSWYSARSFGLFEYHLWIV